MIRAKCDLSIELERPARRYQPGERITGQIRVHVDGETKCDALTLTQQWRTHGKGNRASGPENTIQLFAGEWKQGTHTFPFDLPCPDQPPSYHGRLLNVDWYLDARADVPWAIDAKTSSDFFVELGPEAVPDVSVTSAPAASAAMQVFLIVFLIPFVLVGLGTLGAGVLGGELFLILFGVFWCGIVGLFIWMLVKKRLARQAFKRFTTSLEQVGPRRVAVVADYASDKTINSVTAKLVVAEVVVRGSGTDKTTYRETIHEVSQVVPVGHVGQHNHRVELELPDPRVVGWSFAASDNDLEWYIALEFDIESWPDLDEKLSLVVRPRQGAAQGPYRGASTPDYSSRWGPTASGRG